MKFRHGGLLLALFLVAAIGCGGGSEPASGGSSSGSSGGSSGGSDAGRAALTPAPAPVGGSAAAPIAAPPKDTATAAPEKGGWGHLKGKFVYDGSAPTPAPLTITKDQEFCGKSPVLDESVVVNKDNGGLANVVVFLYVRSGKFPDPHESFAESAEASVEIDNAACRFEPHVCVMRTSQKLILKNSDPVGHNTNIATTANPAFNQTIPASSELEHSLSEAERRPAAVGCNIHPWMKGWVLPQKSPYFAVSGKDGEFEIKNLPSGKWTFQVWQERAGSVDDVTVGGKKTKWSKGRVEVTINGDQTTDLGEIKLSAALFEG